MALPAETAVASLAAHAGFEDVARVDGCTPWQTFRYVTWPFVMPFAFIAMTIRSLDVARAHDIVVIDSPPHAQTEARIAVRAATLVVAPVQPSPMDLWAVHPTIDLAAQEKRRLLLVLNRVPPRARIADELIAKVHELVDPPAVELAAAQVGNRTAYAGTLMTGLSVTEAARKTQAAAEMQALAEEILGRV